MSTNYLLLLPSVHLVEEVSVAARVVAHVLVRTGKFSPDIVLHTPTCNCLACKKETADFKIISLVCSLPPFRVLEDGAGLLPPRQPHLLFKGQGDQVGDSHVLLAQAVKREHIVERHQHEY